MKKHKLIQPLLGLILLLTVLSCGKTLEHGQTQSQQQLPPDPVLTIYSFSSRFGHFTLQRYQDNTNPIQDTTPPGSSQPPSSPQPPGSPQPPTQPQPPITPTPPTTPTPPPPVVTPPAPPTSPTPPTSHLDTSITRVDTPTTQTPATPTYPQTPIAACAYAPTYGDTLIFPQPTNGQDYIVYPVNNPGTGKYFAWPIGMVLDSVTGAINMTQSQTGMRYMIGFVKSGTTDTCINQLILGGAAYMDSVYVLDNGQTKAYPYYDANPYMPAVCSGGTGCTFDVTGSAAAKKVIIDKATGVIDLQKTLSSGLLGGAFGLIPLDGMSITVPIYYRLNDPSNNALQRIDVQIAYFAKKSLLGAGLLGSITGALDSILSGNVISTSVNPRPPLVVIVRHN